MHIHVPILLWSILISIVDSFFLIFFVDYFFFQLLINPDVENIHSLSRQVSHIYTRSSIGYTHFSSLTYIHTGECMHWRE